MTYTYAILKVSPRAFAEIADRLNAAGYASAFHDEGDDGVVIDMHGIALARASLTDATEIEPGTTIEIGTILSQRTKAGMVELALNEASTQMDLDKAREVLGMLQSAIEAAVSDQLLFAFLTTKIGVSPEQAARALLDFRELRQGSRSTVFPS
jgi:hypothetical protein